MRRDFGHASCGADARDGRRPATRRRPGRTLALLAIAALLAGLPLAAACVSRNVESIDREEAEAIPPPPPPGAGSPAPGASDVGAASTEGLSGVVEVPDDLAGLVPADATLFLIVRIAGREGGAPLAVQRHASPRFPLRFHITEQDAMMPNTPLVGDMTVSARLDQDGDALTTTSGDLVGEAGPVNVGASGIRISLSVAEAGSP